MAPIVDGLAAEYEDSVAIRKYDVGGNSAAGLELGDRYGVQYVPTFVFVTADGEVTDTIIGETSESDLRDALDALR